MCEAVKALSLSPLPQALLIVDGIARKFKFKQVRAAANDALRGSLHLFFQLLKFIISRLRQLRVILRAWCRKVFQLLPAHHTPRGRGSTIRAAFVLRFLMINLSS